MANIFGYSPANNASTVNTNNNGGNVNPRKKGSEQPADAWFNLVGVVTGKDANGKAVVTDFSETNFKPVGSPAYLTDGKLVRSLIEKAEQAEDDVVYIMCKVAVRRVKEKPADDGTVMDIVSFDDF